MSKKRSSAESNDEDDQTNEGSESTFQKEGSTKRIKLDSLCDATIQYIPIEILEFILLKAVTMEVNGMKLAKCVWEEKADLVMNRLNTVCSEWTSIVATDFFRSKVHRILEGTAPKTFRCEMLQQSKTWATVVQATTVKDEIFVLCKLHAPPDKILVYDCNNTTPVKYVVSLPGKCPMEIAGCNVSSCVYVLNMESQSNSVLRFTKDVQHKFSISPWISDIRMPISTISVTASSGNLVVLSRDLLPIDGVSREPLSKERLSKDPLTKDLLRKEFFSNVPPSEKRRPLPSVVRIYNSNGSMQTEITLSPNIYSTRNAFSTIQKSNGNLLLGSTNDRFRLVLTEMDKTGRILRQYQSEIWGAIIGGASFTEIGGRILISSGHSAMELLDSELNPLDSSGLQTHEGKLVCAYKLHYNRERNEIVRVGYHLGAGSKVLAIFRLTEE